MNQRIPGHGFLIFPEEAGRRISVEAGGTEDIGEVFLVAH